MTKATTIIIICCLLLIACGGKETIIIVQDDDGAGGTTSAAGAGGSVGEGGMGGSATSAAGGSGGDGGGEGGAGGMEPMCPAPSCPQPADADFIINCDPACGALSPECANVCGSAVSIPVGHTIIRTPPLSGAVPECETLCETQTTWWALMMSGPPGVDGCMSGAGPDGGLAGLANPNLPYTQCHDNGGPCSATHQGPAVSMTYYVNINPIVQQAEAPDSGAEFHVWLDAAPCQQNPPACPAGCNGAGGTP